MSGRRRWVALAPVLALSVAVPALLRGGPAAVAQGPAAGATGASIRWLERRLAARPDDHVIAGVLAERHLRRFRETGDLAHVRRAETLARMAARIVPGAAPYARLAHTLLTQHRFAEAGAAIRIALARDSTHAGANAIAFDVFLETGAVAEARRVLDRLDPRRFASAARAAKWLEAHGRFREAAWEMERACRGARRGGVDPATLAWCEVEQAILAVHLGDAGAAERHLAAADVVWPGYRGAVETRAWRDYRAGRLSAARAGYARLARGGGEADAHLMVARIAERQGDTAAARRHVQAFLAAARAPGAEALYRRHLALHLAEQADGADEAVRLARVEVAIRPSGESYGVLAWALFARGDTAAAWESARRATAWGSPDATRLFHAGLIARGAGRTSEAAALLRRAVTRRYELDPADEREAHRLLAGALTPRARAREAAPTVQ